MIQSDNGWVIKGVDGDVRITDQVMEAEFSSCSPRNGVSGRL